MKHGGAALPGHGKVCFSHKAFLGFYSGIPKKGRITSEITGMNILPVDADGDVFQHRLQHLMRLPALLLRPAASQNLPGELSVPCQDSPKKEQKKPSSPRQPGEDLFPGGETAWGNVDPPLQNHIVGSGGERGEKAIHDGDQGNEVLAEGHGRLRRIRCFEGGADLCIAFHLSEVLKSSAVDKAVGHLSSANPLQHLPRGVVEAEGYPRIISGDMIHSPGGALDSERGMLDIVEILYKGIFHVRYH